LRTMVLLFMAYLLFDFILGEQFFILTDAVGPF